MLVGSIIGDGKTLSSFSLFGADGTFQWDFFLK
jgi:vacuolar-type H+-ATPase subunit F/Vma7